MTWLKPKSPRHWLLLCVPAALCIVPTLIGFVAQPKDADWMAWSIVGLFVASLLSFGLSIWLASPNPTNSSKFGCFILSFAILMIINFAVSFAGCTIGWSNVSGMSFR